MNALEILEELRPLGKETYKKVLTKNHGIPEPVFGVPISELKKIQRRVKRDYQLALDLFATGNYDAMYLAGLIADDSRMTREDLNRWVAASGAGSLCGSTIPSVAVGGPHGWELGLQWIDSPLPATAAAGWATLGGVAAVKPDEDLDFDAYRALLERVERDIHQAPDAPRYAMNNFVICVGAYIVPLSDLALETAERIGKVVADLGNNSCQVPFAPDYIRKVWDRGALGKKRKTLKC